MSDLFNEVVGLRGDVRREIGDVSVEIATLRADIGDLREEISKLLIKIGEQIGDDLPQMHHDIARLDIEIAGLPEEIRQPIVALLTKIGDQIGGERISISAQIGDLHTQTHDDIANITYGLRDLHNDIQREIGDLRTETVEVLRLLLERQNQQNRRLYWVSIGIILLIFLVAEGFHVWPKWL